MACGCHCPCFGRKSTVDREEKDPTGMPTSTSSEDGNKTEIPGILPGFLPGNNDNVEPGHHGSRKQLYSANGYNIAIHADGSVKGTQDHNNKWAILEFSAPSIGEVRIKGDQAQLYLAMDDHGRLHAKADGTSDDTIFIERYKGGYLYYTFKKNTDWYIGITKAGRPKNGKKTAIGQKATMFVPRAAPQ